MAQAKADFNQKWENPPKVCLPEVKNIRVSSTITHIYDLF